MLAPGPGVVRLILDSFGTGVRRRGTTDGVPQKEPNDHACGRVCLQAEPAPAGCVCAGCEPFRRSRPRRAPCLCCKAVHSNGWRVRLTIAIIGPGPTVWPRDGAMSGSSVRKSAKSGGTLPVTTNRFPSRGPPCEGWADAQKGPGDRPPASAGASGPRASPQGAVGRPTHQQCN